jgi:hypothetical protein
MKTCESCQHWDHTSGWDDLEDYTVARGLDADYDDASVLAVVAENQGRWGSCRQVSHGWGNSQRAYVMDASDYAATLHTRNDFGCVEQAERAGLTTLEGKP